MSAEKPALDFRDSIEIAVDPDRLYDLVSDVPRTGEWSPVCRGCEWSGTHDPTAGPRVGDTFTGTNDDGTRTWQTQATVVAAERGSEFAWEIGAGFVRWGFEIDAIDGGSRLTESWTFLPAGIAMFGEKWGDEADAAIARRSDQALSGVPATLAAIKAIAERAGK